MQNFQQNSGHAQDKELQRSSTVSTKNLLARVISPWSGQSIYSEKGSKFLKSSRSEHITSQLASILPHCFPNVPPNAAKVDLGWYCWWVDQQVTQMPDQLFSILSEDARPAITENFVAIWKETSIFLVQHTNPSIDVLVDHLTTNNLFINDSSREGRHRARFMALAIVGWQTMLFRADYGSCPVSKFAISEEMYGHRGQAHVTLQCDETRSRRSLHDCLMGFGVILPPRNCDLEELKEHKAAFAELRTISPSTLNAALFVNVARWKIEWTDCLACHLELDLRNKLLYVFRFPSFCIANRVVQDHDGIDRYGTMHACAQDSAGRAIWATHGDVSQMLEEILMSYRLLFGQNESARKLFRSLSPFSHYPAQGRDQLLYQLCGRKGHCDWLQRPDREAYDMQHDFPLLRSRLAKIVYELSLRKPHTWKELWQDRRDSAQWATFWIILIMGGLGLLFAFAQIVLQILQLTLNK